MLSLEPLDEIYKSKKLELLTMKIQYLNIKKHPKECKKVYYEAINLIQEIVPDPRFNAIICEEGGKIDMRQKDYEKALEKFKNAFFHYKSAGENDKAKLLLRYEILSSLISRSKSSIFSPEEAKPYMNDKQLVAMLRLHEAYEHMDIDGINRIWNSEISKNENDEFILENLNEILHNIRLNYICEKLNAFRVCKFATLERVNIC
jgi:tetratricopeptide (TPR) repeat protein